MKEQRQFTLQTLVATLVLNAGLLVAVYLAGGPALSGRMPIVFGAGAVLTVILWLAILLIGRRLLDRAAAAGAGPKAKGKPAAASAKQTAASPGAQPSAPLTARPPAAQSPEPSDAAAVQILSILQRKGRLIDFLQEDIRAYEDAQIGAAVRNVHEGCREALTEYVTLEPIFKETEGGPVTLKKGFDAKAIRLIGNVRGEPPFQGILRHRGWKAVRIALPERVGATTDERIVAAAEVEMGD